MAIIELESAPEEAAISEAVMNAGTQVEIKLSDDLRAEILQEISRRVDPEKINLAVRLVIDCPKCKVPLESRTTVILEYRKTGTPGQETAIAVCGDCADAHMARPATVLTALGLERTVIDGRLMAWS